MKERHWLVLSCLACVLGCSENGVENGIQSEPQFCEPACVDGQVCVEGKCMTPSVESECKGSVCRDDKTYCNHLGLWASCDEGETCSGGECVKGTTDECETGSCSVDGTQRCAGGRWMNCKGLEVCTNGRCGLPDTSCEPGSCSSDGLYYCDGDKTYQACEFGYACEHGSCVPAYDKEKSGLWQLCFSDDDCDVGTCLVSVTASAKLSNAALNVSEVNQIRLSEIDSRILYGQGVCSVECTTDAGACESLSVDGHKFSCQLLVAGDLMYPPKDEQGHDLSLPFHEALDESAMQVAPYVAICRPADMENARYSSTAFSKCASHSWCGEDELCVSGECLPRCTGTEMCPYGFSCLEQPAEGDEAPISVCVPNSGTTRSCLDTDGDGQGYGLCEKPGVDCAPTNPEVYYSASLPKSCVHGAQDVNCNGKIDSYELMGSPEHCRFCGDVCALGTNAVHIDRSCLLKPGQSLDDSHYASFDPEDEATYVSFCRDQCETGWADCNGNPNDGCEVQLLILNADGNVKATDSATVYARDMDQDGHGVVDAQYHQYCCGDSDVCYAMPQTHYNRNAVWGLATNPDFVTDTDADGHEVKVAVPLSTVLDECDDSDVRRYLHNKELCDGIDNDCDASTADGLDETLDGKWLGDKCTVMNGTAVCTTNGKIICDPGKGALVCYNSEASGTDDDCDGIDDDCDGLVDEDYQPTACQIESVAPVSGVTNICSYGVNICQSGGQMACIPLYEPRDYDFYGDGIDSNCDGYDYDVKHAVFVNGYDDENRAGRDWYLGGPTGPVTSLNVAIQKACSNMAGGNYCHDVIVGHSVGMGTSSEDTWAKTPLVLPRFSYIHTWNLGEAPAQVSDLYASCQIEGCAKDRLFPGEVYAPKEAVRVYGGFTVNSDSVWTKSDSKQSVFHYKLPSSSEHSASMISGKTGVHYPISVRFEDMKFVFDGTGHQLSQNNGFTMTGLSCGASGCQHLTFVNSVLEVLGASGKDSSGLTHGPNQIWGHDVHGTGGGHQFEGSSWSSSKSAFSTNRMSNACFPSSYYEDSWHVTSSSLYSLTCPDGKSPRGGAAASSCCQNNCSELNYSTGKSGYVGGDGGTGGNGKSLSITKNEGCNADTSYQGTSQDSQAAGSDYHGGNGGNGYGGLAGEFTSEELLTACTRKYDSHGVYVSCNHALGNGGIGHSGGGGGGGAVYHCYGNVGAAGIGAVENAWVFAGSGGSGGCGGYAGVAGGTGASVVGLQLLPPNYGNLDLDIQTNFTLHLKAGLGGAGQSGQDGLLGGWRGYGFGYAKENSLTIDQYCHKATGGGNGGGGGGGGGGAGGLSGEAYGMIFICNRGGTFDTSTSIHVDQLNACGFPVSSSFASTWQNYLTMDTVYHGSTGKAGKQGKSITSASDDRQNTQTGGQAGKPGESSTAGQKYHYFAVQNMLDF